jgi:hypothetical protein
VKRLILLSALVIAGCGGPSFENEVDEFRYLSSLSNPTPEQWKRKKEIADHKAPSPYSGTVEYSAKCLERFTPALHTTRLVGTSP